MDVVFHGAGAGMLALFWIAITRSVKSGLTNQGGFIVIN